MSKLEKKIKSVHKTLTHVNARLDKLIEEYEQNENYEMCYLLLNYRKLLDTDSIICEIDTVLGRSHNPN